MLYPKYQKIAIFFTERIKQYDVLALCCRFVIRLSHSYNSSAEANIIPDKIRPERIPKRRAEKNSSQ